MTMSTPTAPARVALTGPRIIQVFLGELSDFVRRHPDQEVDGTARQIVEEVVTTSSRFADCTEKTIENLSHQLTMAITHKGGGYRLGYRRLSDQGRIKVVYA